MCASIRMTHHVPGLRATACAPSWPLVSVPAFRHPTLSHPRISLKGPLSVPPSAASDAAGSVSIAHRITHLTTCYSDPKANSKFLVLVVGQSLCSIATLIHDSYLPVYAQDVLGLSNTSIGAVQGIAQFLCQITKGVSGVAGDLLGSQVRVLVFGTFMTLLCKPMFVMLSGVHAVFGATACLYWFFFAKLMDRMSKGIREAPTKAIMNDLAAETGDSPDAAYGLRQSLATAGMLVGSTVASLTFTLTGQNYIATFAVAMVPPLLALVWMVKNFRDEVFGTGAFAKPTAESKAAGAAAAAATSAAAPLISSGESPEFGQCIDLGEPADTKVYTFKEKAITLLTSFKPAYWQALLVVSVLYFSRFDASFLSLRAKSIMSKSALPMLTLTNSIIQVVLTAPLARYSGKCVANRNFLLMVGFAIMICTNACFGMDQLATPEGMFLGAAFLGLHMAMTHAITVSMVASYMPTGNLPGIGKIGGTAVSFTDLLLGLVLVSSNMVAGVLSDWTRQQGLGNVGCFGGGAIACVAASLLLALFSKFGDLGKDELVMKRKKKQA